MTISEFTRFAVVTEHGIMYQATHYSCTQAIQEQWFSKAVHHGGWSVQVCLRTMDKSRIYIFYNEEFIVCNRVQHQIIPEDKKYLYFLELERLKKLKRNQRKYCANHRRLKKLKSHYLL